MAKGPKFEEYLHSPDQYLNPAAIYTLSWVLGETLASIEVANDECWVVPSVFDKKTRSWHWACVLREFFNPNNQTFVNSSARLLLSIAKDENDLGKAFELAKSNLLDIWAFKDAAEKLAEKIEAAGSHVKSCATCQQTTSLLPCMQQTLRLGSQDAWSKLHRELLLFYYGFKIHRAQMLPGILYRGCMRYNSKTAVESFEGKPDAKEPEVLQHGTYNNYDRTPIADEGQFHQLDYDVISSQDFYNRGGPVVLELIRLFYADELQKQIDIKTTPVVVLPIYDVWLGNKGHGGLWGCLILTFESDEKKTTFLSKHFDNLRRECEWLTTWIEVAAMAVISGEPINPPYDLVEHFVRTLIHMQDWERVAVFRRHRDNKTRLYCYQRNEKDGTKDANWERCNPDAEQCGKCEKNNWKRLLKWDFPKRNQDDKWTLWSQDLMPELTKEEEDSFRDITCEFEYPQSVYVPTDDITTKLFEFAVIDQQIRVLRTLIPRVRARRAALRNAAVSIMGRNMSHNIGSHVLARMSTSGSAKTEEVSKLLAFLQERMDFIAEVSTTRSFMSLPTYFYGEVICDFAGAAALPEGKSDPKSPGQTLLLEHISGIEKRPAVAKSMNTATEEYRFGCPGGTVGQHALYVIIENIIRNTAKHTGNGSSGNVQVFIRVGVDTEYLEFYQVTVWDGENKGQVLKELNDEQLKWFSGENKLRLSSDRTITVQNGNKVTTADFIQLAIEKEPLIDGDGVVRPNHWGIREIYLAAAYLRSIPLEELETPVPVDNPPILQALLVNADGYAAEDLTNGSAAEHCTNLGYRFYLERAHVAAVIREEDPGKETRERLKDHGIDIYMLSPTENEDEKKKAFHDLAKAGFKHTYLTVPSEKHKKWLRSDSEISRSLLPVAELVEESALALSNPESVERELAKRYREQMLTKPDCNLAMAFVTGDKPGAECEHQGLRSSVAADVADQWCECCTCLHYEKEVGDVVSALKPDKSISLSNGLKIQTKSGLVFDLHGRVAGANGVSFDFRKLAELGFYERYRSESAQRHIIMESGVSPRKCVNKSLLTIAALTRVLILDERLQGALNETARSWDNGTVGSFLRLARIFVPSTTDCDLNKPSARAIEDWVTKQFTNTDSWLAINFCQMDFLVIHQGILDRLSGLDGKEPKAWLVDLAEQLKCEDRIVVCSGRGAPSNIPDFARFVPVSTILAWTIHRPSKFHLVNALLHARHPKLILERR